MVFKVCIFLLGGGIGFFLRMSIGMLRAVKGFVVVGLVILRVGFCVK